MIRGFGTNSYSGVVVFAGLYLPREIDPIKPCPRAAAEMEAFDLLPPEAREAVRSSPNDVALSGKLLTIRQIGAPRYIADRFRARGILPYQVGVTGILAELVVDELRQSHIDEKKTA